jgi:predicted alpha/beta-hydrolase family hydrolase
MNDSAKLDLTLRIQEGFKSHWLVKGEAKYGVVLLAHGSGIAMDHPFMDRISHQLSCLGLYVIRFEFPYMAMRRETARKRLPDKMQILESHYIKMVQQVRSLCSDQKMPLYLAGKSMGGRVATLIADQCAVDAVFVYGYPFHPAGKPDKLRVAHLMGIKTPIYVFQGERDKLGAQHEVAEYELGKQVSVQWLEDADHDLKPRVRSGYSQKSHLDTIACAISAVINQG